MRASRGFRRVWSTGVALVLSAGFVACDERTPPAPASDTARWSGKKPPTPTPVPGPPIDLTSDLKKRWRRSEYDRTLAEPLAVHVPETSPGLASPEQLARAYVEALSRLDRDAVAGLTMGRRELDTLFGDALTEKSRRGILIEAGSVFLGLADLPAPMTIEAGAFTPGQLYLLHPGVRIEGVLIESEAKMLDRSLLDVTIGGAARRLEFMMMVELSGRWRLFERVFIREAAP